MTSLAKASSFPNMIIANWNKKWIALEIRHHDLSTIPYLSQIEVGKAGEQMSNAVKIGQIM